MSNIKLILLIFSLSSEVFAAVDSANYMDNAISGVTINNLFANSSNYLVPTVNSCDANAPIQGSCNKRYVIKKPLKCATTPNASGCYDSSYTVSTDCTFTATVLFQQVTRSGSIYDSQGKVPGSLLNYCTSSSAIGTKTCKNINGAFSRTYTTGSMQCYKNGVSVSMSECNNACTLPTANAVTATPTIS